MRFETPLLPARLLRRYKRFLADVRLEADGSALTVHSPNTGSMLGCAEPGSRIWVRRCEGAKRKYPYSWELTEAADGVLVGVNPGRANGLVREAIEAGRLPALAGYRDLRGEVRYGEEGSRIDLLLEGAAGRCFIEVKSVTALDAAGRAMFPDAVSARGSKHLRELARIAAGGERAVLFFCVQRGDARAVRPADEIDPLYAATLREAAAAGVEVMAAAVAITPEQLGLAGALPVALSDAPPVALARC